MRKHTHCRNSYRGNDYGRNTLAIVATSLTQSLTHRQKPTQPMPSSTKLTKDQPESMTTTQTTSADTHSEKRVNFIFYFFILMHCPSVVPARASRRALIVSDNPHCHSTHTKRAITFQTGGTTNGSKGVGLTGTKGRRQCRVSPREGMRSRVTPKGRPALT